MAEWMERPLLWNEILQRWNKKLQGPKIHQNVHYFCTFTSIEISIHCYVNFKKVETWVKLEPLDRTINSQKASDSFEKQTRYFQTYATTYRQLILTKLSLNIWILPSPWLNGGGFVNESTTQWFPTLFCSLYKLKKFTNRQYFQHMTYVISAKYHSK